MDRAWLGNFRITPAVSYLTREDDLASSGQRGLADYAAALLKCIEAQARGFAHGHGKAHSIPEGMQAQRKCLEEVHQAILDLLEASGGERPAEDDVEGLVQQASLKFNARVLASAQTCQYESAVLPAKQLGQAVREALFSDKQQRQSRYDGGLEEDGLTRRPLVPIVPPEPPAHVAREDRRAEHGHLARRNVYREVPLTGCQLCAAPHYLLPQSFGLVFEVGEEGEVEDDGITQLPGLPWVFDGAAGQLTHFLAGVAGTTATSADFESDARVFERCFGRDVRFCLAQH